MLINNKIPLTYIFSAIKVEIIYTLIIWLITYFSAHGYMQINPQIPLTIPAFIGTAISIILSFKLSQSYDRWWEARKIWGTISNESRVFILGLQSFIKPTNNTDIRTIAFRHIAWCFSLGQSLRGLNAIENLDRYLSAEDIKLISNTDNKPLAILQLNTRHITDLKNNEFIDAGNCAQLHNTLVNLANAMGMTERIKSTVFPVTYSLFLHWMIYLFTIVLSLAVYDMAWYFELPLLMAISSIFFLLEKAASQLQDPFSNTPTDTAMTSIATNIEINIKQLLNETEIPQPFPPNKFYLL